MQRQFALWPDREPAAPLVWKNLDDAERTRLILALAKLITRAAQPPSPNTRMENIHER